ncbi:13496_t:CDS:2 [Dentiscutata heterogama]|uniref:13496_t:CDS:1 n=1 Tax=Dentiscutata heterogama TaxID=1316150 RepID=A0ACA9M6Q7_9GLOM|nr:13496_t:CDS:2 [Dentiscutata heterogama]
MKPELMPTDEFSEMECCKLQDVTIITFKKTNWSPRERRFISFDLIEDSTSIDLELGKKHSQAKGFYFFSVYDGHGVNGMKENKHISKICSENLPKNIAKSLPRFWSYKENNVKKAIKKGFKNTEQLMRSGFSKVSRDAGCTALVAVMTPLKDIYVAYIGDSPAYISPNNGGSIQITKEHDLHNKNEVLRLRAQKSNGTKFSIYRLAPDRREKFWALDNTFSRGMQYTRSFGDFYIKDKAKNTEPDFAEKVYNAKDLNLLVLCSDGITNRLRVYKRMPTEVLLSYMKQNKFSSDLIESACKDLVKLCDLISQSGYCTDDMSIIIIAFLNGRSLQKWYEDATKDAEYPRDWLNPTFKDDDDISEISAQDLGEVESPVKDNGFDIYDTSNQYSAEEAEEFADMTVPDF